MKLQYAAKAVQGSEAVFEKECVLDADLSASIEWMGVRDSGSV